MLYALKSKTLRPTVEITVTLNRLLLGLFATLCLLPSNTAALAQTTRTWTGSSGDWFTAANWAPAGVPSALDTAVINSGTATANAAVSIAGLNLSSGTLSGTGDVTINTALNWTGGSMSGAGRTIIAAGATMAITANGSTSLSRALDNNGAATMSGINSWNFNTATAIFSNLAGATFTASGGVMSNNCCGGPAFNNAGTFTKTGPGTLTIGIAFNNTGTLDLTGGTLGLNGGTSNYASATNTFSGGLWAIQQASTLLISNPASIVIRTIAPATSITLAGATSNFNNSIGTNVLATLANNNGTLTVAARTLPITPFGGTLTNTNRITARVGGTIAVTGGFAQTPSGTVKFELGGITAGQFGTITASTQAVLAGNGEATFVSPPYTPVNGDSFAVIVAPIVSVTFPRVCSSQVILNQGVVPVPTPTSLLYVVSPSGTAGTAAAIVTQPEGSAACPPSVTFSVEAIGSDLAYQWQRETTPNVYANLTDSVLPSGAVIVGSDTDRLTLFGSTLSEGGQYRVLITNSCSGIASDAITLVIPQRCSLADIVGSNGGPNQICGDSIVDGADFIAFINSFSVGDPTIDPVADVAGGGNDGLQPDGITDGNDFIAFINAFAAGC